jgi:hypothetical protein
MGKRTGSHRRLLIVLTGVLAVVLFGLQGIDGSGSAAAQQTQAERSKRRPKKKPRPRPTTTTVAPTTVAPTTSRPTTTVLPTTSTTTSTVAPTTTTSSTTTVVPPVIGGPRTPRPFPTGPTPFQWTRQTFSEPFAPVGSPKPGITGAIAPGWFDGSAQFNADVAYSQAPGFQGGSAQRMNVTAIAGGPAQLYRGLEMVAGWRYEATLKMKGVGRATVGFQDGGPRYALFGDTAVELTPDWQTVRVTGMIAESSQGALLIQAVAVADITVDDIEIRAVRQSPATVTGTQITGDTFGIHEGRISSMALRNSSFEGPGRLAGNGQRSDTGSVLSGSVATGWSENSFWADVTAKYTIDTTTFRSAPSSQRIDVDGFRSGAVQIGQYMYVKTPGRLRFSTWVRGTAGRTASIVIRQSELPYESYYATDVVLTGQWQQLVVEGDLGATQNNVFFHLSFDGTGTYSIDDASLLNVTTGKAPDWIPAPSVGGTMRLWDTSTTWSQLEPQKGQWDFAILDRFVALAEQRNQKVLLTLGQSPEWATKNLNVNNYYGIGSAFAPKSMEDWRNMVRVIATKYRGRIDAYEIWNEPNDANFGNLSMDELVELTKVASQELRLIDPAAKVVSASPYSAGYLDSYIASGAMDYVDIIGYHWYDNKPEEMANQLANVNAILNDYSISKPVWLTEGGSGDEKQSESETADALLRWNLVAVASGMQRSLWYTWGPGINLSGATIKPGSWEPNAAFMALADMAQRLRGRTLTKTTVDPVTGRWALEFTNSAGNVLTASWTRNGTAAAQPVVWS